MHERTLLLATGGTIASRPNADGAVTAALTGADLLELVDGLDDRDGIDVVDLAQGASWNFEPTFMAELAITARDAITSGRARGVVVTHGTDTVADTAFMTELLAGGATPHGPIVFTCAMRNAGELSQDGPRNLAHAIATARDPRAAGRGVLLCVNDELHAARWVTKTDTSAISTFRSPHAGPVGRIVDGRPHFHLESPSRPPAPAAIDPAVAAIASFGGVDGAIVGWHLDRGAHGLVVEGTGAGNVSAALVPGVERAIADGVPVVITSRCWTGSVAPVYGGPGGGATTRALGAIGGGDLGTSKARIALMAALGIDPSPEAIAAWFQVLLQ